MLKALVILSNERSQDMGALLAIARAEAQKREHTHKHLKIRNILYCPVTKVFVALYECSKPLKQGAGKDVRNESNSLHSLP